MSTLLETQRLLLRSFTLSDLHQFAAIQADKDVMHYLGGVQTFEQSHRQLLQIIEVDRQNDFSRFAVVEKDTANLIGYCGFKPAGEFVDLGYQYSKETWGNGYGLEAAKAARTYGLATLGIRNMEAGGAAANIASVRIMEQLGFAHREELTFNGQPAVRFFD